MVKLRFPSRRNSSGRTPAREPAPSDDRARKAAQGIGTSGSPGETLGLSRHHSCERVSHVAHVAAHSVTSAAHSAAHAIGNHVHGMQVHAIEGATRHTVEPIVGLVLDMLEDQLFRGLVDPLYEPQCLHGTSSHQSSHLDSLKSSITDSIVQVVSEAMDFDHKRLLMITGLGALDISFREAPLRALRARMLHSLYPADETFWYKVRSPLFTLKVLLMLINFCGINRWIFVLLFGLINRRCEYQLLHLLATAQLCRFLCVGLPSLPYLIYGSGGFLECTRYLEHREAELERASFGPNRPAEWYVDSLVSAAECRIFHRPEATDEWLLLLSEVVRSVTLLLVFVHLRYARGGPELLKALEMVAVDAADGKMDGVFDEERLLAGRTQSDDTPSPSSQLPAHAPLGGDDQALGRVQWTEGQIEHATARAYVRLRAAAEKKHAQHRKQTEPLEYARRNGGPAAAAMLVLELVSSLAFYGYAFACFRAAALSPLPDAIEPTGYTFRMGKRAPWEQVEVALLFHALMCFPYVIFIVAPVECEHYPHSGHLQPFSPIASLPTASNRPPQGSLAPTRRVTIVRGCSWSGSA